MCNIESLASLYLLIEVLSLKYLSFELSLNLLSIIYMYTFAWESPLFVHKCKLLRILRGYERKSDM
jgi:hypothetical protein